MTIETTEELSEQIADWIGIYGACKSDDPEGCPNDNPLCCRVEFVRHIQERMIRAVENDKKLQALNL